MVLKYVKNLFCLFCLPPENPENNALKNDNSPTKEYETGVTATWNNYEDPHEEPKTPSCCTPLKNLFKLK